MVFVGSCGDNYVYALDADTGAVKWKYKTGSEGSSSPAVAEGVVFVGSSDDYVYALDADTGAVKWKYETSFDVDSSPAVAEGVVFVGSLANYLYALDADIGAVKWKYKTGFNVDSSPAVADGMVFVGSWDDYMYALDADTGAVKWKYKTGAYVRSSPAVSEGVVFVGSDDNYVYALDADTGAVKWKYKTGGSVDSSPAVADGVVFVGSLDNYVYALDADTGAVKWKYKTGRYVDSSPAVADGVVFVGSSDGYVYAFISKSKIAQSAISTAESAIESANKIGADTTDTQNLLGKAQTALSNKQYQDAIDYANRAKIGAELTTKLKIEAPSAISAAESAIESANKIGAHTTEAQNLLNQARAALSSKQYQDAISYANQAKISAEKAGNARLIQYGVAIFLILVSISFAGVKIIRRKESEGKIKEYRAKIEQWKREGYNVSELEEMLK